MNRGKKKVGQGAQGRKVIASGGTSGGSDPRTGLWLHFDAGTEVSHDSLRRSLAGSGHELLSHDFGAFPHLNDPANSGPTDTGQPAYELLLDGLTFDAHILPASWSKGGPVYQGPAGIPVGSMAASALTVVPGPHLSGGPRGLPVVRTQFRLAARLCVLLPGVVAAGWGPSASIIARDDFCAQVAAWEKGGHVPSPGVITFRPAMGHALQSSGLAYFTGQELRIEASLATETDYAARLGLRIAETLMLRAAVSEVEMLTAPSGETVRIEPSANGRFVRVWPG